MNKILSYKMKNIRGNKGFTLVELIVVLVLLSILLGTTLYAGLGWQDWAQFKHEEACAEEIFYAAQNQLTELDSSNALYRKVARPMMNSDTEGDYIAGYVVNNIDQIVYDRDANGDVKYNSKTIWINSNKDKDPGKLVRLRANANEYDTYVNNPSACGEEAKLLFDIISPYISDKSVLNGAIILEFSPDAGQVFSVCYSDKASSLTYGAEGSGAISVMNRILQVREEKMLGYFSVDTLSKKIRGRGTIDTNLKLRIDNGEVYSLVVEDDEAELENNDLLEFNLYDGENDGSVSLMSFSVSNSVIPTYSSFGEGLEDIQGKPVTVDVVYPDTYSVDYNSVEKFRVPIFRVGDLGSKNQVYVILDAADVQAQSLAFSKSIYFKDSSPYYTDETKEAFMNTYSFYRFGLSSDINYLYADVSVTKCNDAGESIATSKSPVNSYSEDPSELHVRQSCPKGECVAFASHELADGNNVYEIENMRHFYNVRYESDYKIDENKKDTFKLIADLSWADFIGGNDDGINYFLNSYVNDNTIKNGINYNGNIECVSGDTTAEYPFPGFRKLDKNDKFTQDTAYGGSGDSFTISDLDITIAGNIVYGVYGTDIKESCKLGDFSSTQGYIEKDNDPNYNAQDSKRMKPARAGKMPLGLFAENQGVIENITLNRHQVIGVMNVTQGSTTSLLYTCMVGGFAGNNLGHISNLTLLDHTSNTALSTSIAEVTKVNGRTDVGGIIGRQSYIVKDAFDSTDVTISGLKNYGTVSGLENVGGIVGRAYTRFVTDKTDAPESFTNVYTNPTYNGASITSYRQVVRRYYAYHDGYDITDTYKSMTGADVLRNNVITISDCHNRGKVSGEELFYSYLDNKTIRAKNLNSDNASAFNNNKVYSCSFIGGIAGASMDGIINDFNNFKENGKTIYESKCEQFANGGEAYIKIKNCDSFIKYDIDPEKITDASTYPSIKYDNYVGGLVGYSKMTAIENCNTKQDDYIAQSQSFVLGNRFVGGLVGCSDFTRFDTGNATPNPNGYNNRIYAATNYNNVIGRVFVGGIAGGMGIGGNNVSNNPNDISYRDPSTNLARYVSGMAGEVVDGNNDGVNESNRNKPVISRNILNTGAVLCLKNTDTNNPFKEYGDGNLGAGFASQTRAGYCGGITGLAYTRFSDADNIQSEETKALILRLLNNNTNLDINSYNEQQVADTVIDKLDNSPFGGIHVGGIVGYISSSNKVNYSNNTASYVDAVVCGQNFVGGIIGDTSENNWAKAFNCYPVKKSSSSSGMTVIGDDCVGGLFGRLPHDMILTDESEINSSYTVIGRYAVGGFVGMHEYNGGNTHGRIDANLVPNDGSSVKVYGKCFVGGVLGYSSSEQIGIPPTSKTAGINFNNVRVVGDYFVGGLAGGLADNSDSFNILAFIKRINVGDNVSVQANAFGGGVSGLYYVIPRVDRSSCKEFINNGSSIYDIANNKCIYAGDDKVLSTFDNIVNADNRGDAIFNKDASRVVSTDFGNYTNNVDVTSRIFAGGLFGYVPNCKGDQKINIKGFVNGGSIKTTSYVPGTRINEASDTAANYSYLGGVIGRVPRGMMLINCTNTKNGDEYKSEGTYIGGLTEVNAGVISGDISKDSAGVITVDSYLVNNTDYTYDKNIGAFAGVNGTLATGCEGVIQFAQNRGNIESTTGEASGIVASQVGASVVTNSINLGSITGTSKASGIVASPSGTDTIELCRNYGKINASSKYGIAGGVVGMLTNNLEASGLNESNNGTPIASKDNTNFRMNFYIYGDENGLSDTPGEWYQINYLEYYLKKNASNHYYYDTYGENYKQDMKNAHTANSSGMYSEFQNTYLWTKDIVLAHFNNDEEKYHEYSALVFSAYMTIRNKQGRGTSVRDYLDFYHSIVTNNTIPNDLYSPSYYNTESIWITECNRSGLFETSFNDSISDDYKTAVIPDEKFNNTNSWVRENGNDTYYKLYSVSSYSPIDIMNNIVYGNDSAKCALYPAIPDAYITIFNGNKAEYDKYLSKLFAYYELQHGGDLFNDWWSGRWSEFASLVNERLSQDCTRTIVYPDGVELIQGESYSPHWPLQLYSIANDDNGWDLKYRDSTGGTIPTSITELDKNPIGFPDELQMRIQTYIGSGLDDKFVNMVKNSSATNYIPE